MTFRDRLRTGKVGIGRFGPLQRTMRKVGDHSELENLRAAGAGFIINIRGDQAKTHRATCETLEVMSTSAHIKIFSETADDAVQWLDANRELTWEHCGLCGGCREIRGTQI